MRKELKPKKCKECKKEFKPYNPLQPVCSPVCALEYNKKLNQKKDALKWKEERKKLVDKLKTITQYKQEARSEFQKWVRLRDKNEPCISCGTKQSTVWDSGHYWKAEIYSGVIFHTDNVHKQCRKCNTFLGGNELNYRDGLLKKIGSDRYNRLEILKNETRYYKYTKEELIEIKNYYKQKIKELNA